MDKLAKNHQCPEKQHDGEPIFRRSSGENQTRPMINMIIYYIYHWLLIKILQLVSMCMVEYSMMRSAGVTIAFNPRKFLSGRSGRIDLYALWRSKMHPGWVMFGRSDWPEKMCSSWYMWEGNSLSKSSLVLGWTLQWFNYVQFLKLKAYMLIHFVTATLGSQWN